MPTSSASGSADAMLFDADVLIWVSRRNSKAIRAVDSSQEPSLSVVSYMEVFQGVRDQREARTFQALLVEHDFRTLPLTEAIGHKAATYVEEYALKAGLTATDALIAATAVWNAQTLCTGNAKYFRSISELSIKVFRP